MIQLAGLDERINAAYPAYQEALEANGKEFAVHVYEGANHGFHNDTYATLRPGRRQPRAGAHHRVLQRAPEGLNETSPLRTAGASGLSVAGVEGSASPRAA